MREVTIAATQMACGPDRDENLARAEALVREAAGRGAQVILIQELFETPYFCKDRKQEFFALARAAEDSPAVARMSALAAELGVVLPVSFFERANTAYYNSLAMIDADGRCLGLYRKSHIPDGPGYQEKYYFNPGDTGFKVWRTRFGTIGAAVCWDQWFPEAARAMALQGAELLLYPTAIGSEPQERDHLLRQLVHRRSDRRQGGGGRRGRADGCHRHLRPGGDPRPARSLGPVPGPPAGSLCIAADPRRPHGAGLTRDPALRPSAPRLRSGRPQSFPPAR
jgi:N-carbamoylputrescine amidase